MKVLTFSLAFITALLLLTLGVFYNQEFLKLVDIIKNYLWVAILTILTFFGFAAAGTLKSPSKDFDSFLSNKYTLAGVALSFCYTVGFLSYCISESMLGHISFELETRKSGVQLPATLINLDSRDSTPLRIPARLPLHKGRYVIRLEDHHYEKAENFFEVASTKEETIVVSDKRKMTFKFVVKLSLPSGLSLKGRIEFVDDKNVSTVTDVSFPGTFLKSGIGTYKFSVDDEIHRSTETVIDVTENDSDEHKITLTPFIRKGLLNIQSQPSQSLAKLDGVEIGQTPIKDYAVEFGNHTISLSKAGFNPLSFPISIGNSNTEAHISKQLLRMLIVSIVCSNQLTQFTIAKNKYMGSKSIALTEGKYKIVFTPPGKDTEEMDVDIKKNNQVIIIPN